MDFDVVDAIDQLERLAAELGERGFTASLRLKPQRPTTLSVTNTVAPALTETVFAAPKDGEGLWFWFPWPAPITPIDDIQDAADRIERVLAEVGRPTP